MFVQPSSRSAYQRCRYFTSRPGHCQGGFGIISHSSPLYLFRRHLARRAQFAPFWAFRDKVPGQSAGETFQFIARVLAIGLRGYPALASLSRRAPDLFRRYASLFDTTHRCVERQARRGGARGKSVRFFPSCHGQSFRVTSAGLRFTAAHRVDHIVPAPDRPGLLLAAVSTAASTTWADTSAASNLAARCPSARKGATLNSARHFWM